eukprot:TRINITY_DN28834_c1_g1_i3.p1 TRINITY_DN28834_c1_g1~~TRINITY_DN28834_c1_g1_i3.p1  ORF type:complete len:315 (+),score=66.69 TRINITY_DN28834_c1_g1_i3:315-1259(+)
MTAVGTLRSGDFQPDALISAEDQKLLRLLSPRGSQQGEFPEGSRRNSNVAFVGLGTQLGGNIARSVLSNAAELMLDRKKPGDSVNKEPPSPKVAEKASTAPLIDGAEPRGMFLGLLLNDTSPVEEAELEAISRHRWSYEGAREFAARGKSHLYFIQCLLDLQRNVQFDEGYVLDAKFARACKTFVQAQCRLGNAGMMFQTCTHFLSNSLLFYEWARFLKNVFANPQAGKVSFTQPYLEEVWGRYTKFKKALEDMFGILNTCYVAKYRLPTIGVLISDHMKRRCFSSDAILRSEIFSQEGEGDTLKQIRFLCGLA